MIKATNSGTIMEGGLLLFDAINMEWHTAKMPKDPKYRCVVMATNNFNFSGSLNTHG